MRISKNQLWAACVAAGLIASAGVIAAPDTSDPALKPYVKGDKYTGFVIADPQTREMQEDEFQNPAYLWVQGAESDWSKVEGEAGYSCASCHAKPERLRGVSARYPMVDKASGELMSIEHRINQCRTERMKAPEWKWESDQMLGMSALVGSQSRGMPVNVKIDGEAAPFFKQGEEFYHQRRGQLDMACFHCHVQNPDMMIRSERLSQGMPNGFPTYRLKWQKLGSLHRRFRGCNNQIRAEPYKQGAPEYTALELYVKWRANGLPVETPSVRK